MQLIEQIEVAYFRSIYKFDLTQCSDTNVLFGRNDSGKSNVLRALNLFFNNHTNPEQAFKFDRDFCHARLAEAEKGDGGVRKFVYVKVWFKTPISWQASLGERFWVKKQWSVTTQAAPQIVSSIAEKKKEQYLTRFLNKVRFHYVPAIKDRKIFESLQAAIYDVISSHSEFATSLATFTEAVGLRTDELSKGLIKRLKINSVVSTPSDLTDLFRSLDFVTTSEVGDKYSLTLQRGDGIQVRHIPEILAFLSDNSYEDYHIWGFEEPENSLELANAIDEAKTFRKFGQQSNKQIFLTSHSPAFFSLEDEDVRRYFISRSEERNGRLTSVARPIETGKDLPSELMGETPHLPVISAYLAEAHKQIERHAAASLALTEQIALQSVPIIFVEGTCDVRVFSKAWQVLVKDPVQVRFEPAGGTTKMESLGTDGPIFHRLATDRPVYALVDNDQEGRKLYSNSRLAPGGRWIKHNSNGVIWCRLPFNPEFVTLMTKLNIQESNWPGCLENLFSAEVRSRAISEGSLKLTLCPYDELMQMAIYKKIIPYLTQRDDFLNCYFTTTESDFKETFADWIIAEADKNPGIMEPLRSTMEGLRASLEVHAAG